MEEESRSAITLKVCRNLLKEIRNGDIDHGVSIANMLLSEGPEFAPELLIEIVEAVVELSAQAGGDDSRKFLVEQWPVLKGAHLKRLSRKR